GPTTNNTRDLGTTALRWLKLWATDADLAGSLSTGSTAATSGSIRPPNNNNIAWRNGANSANKLLRVNTADQLYYTGAVSLDGNVLPGTNNAYDLGTTALRWAKLWATDADLSGVLTFAADATAKLSRPSAGALRVDTNLGVGVNPQAWVSPYVVTQVGQAGVITGNTTTPILTPRANSYYDGTSNKAIVTGAGVSIDINGNPGYIQFWNAPSVSAGATQALALRAQISATGTL